MRTESFVCWVFWCVLQCPEQCPHGMALNRYLWNEWANERVADLWWPWIPGATESCPWCCPGLPSSCGSVLTFICLVILSSSGPVCIYCLSCWSSRSEGRRGKCKTQNEGFETLWIQLPRTLRVKSSLLGICSEAPPLQPLLCCFALEPALPVCLCSWSACSVMFPDHLRLWFHALPTPPDLVCRALSQPSDFVAKTTFSWRPCLIPR